MSTTEYTVDQLSRDDVIDRNGQHYRVLEVIEYGYDDFDPGCAEIELVTEPRMPIGTEFFSPSSVVSVVDDDYTDSFQIDGTVIVQSRHINL